MEAHNLTFLPCTQTASHGPRHFRCTSLLPARCINKAHIPANHAQGPEEHRNYFRAEHQLFDKLEAAVRPECASLRW
jgi:hypothetical protein